MSDPYKQMTRCPRCQGEGRVPLQPRLRALLTVLKSDMRSREIVTALGQQRTNVVNQLTELIALKLVERVRNGKGWVYRKVI